MECNHQYANREYWDERFKDEKEFEWLADFDAFKHLILPFLRPDSRILHIGCGSSQMSMQLYNMGYKNITNVDYSKVLIDSCQNLYPNMKWICDDIRSLANIPSHSYDVVLEKATLEALLVTEKSPWSPSDFALQTLDSIFRSIARVLTNDGVYISVSFTQPHFRVPALLRQPGWSVTVLIDSCQNLYPNMKWICDDIRSLANIPSHSYDVVLEKATLEALLVTEKSPWSPSDFALQTLDSIFRSIARVLTNDGVYISISFTQPHFRVPALLRQPGWSVTVNEFGEYFHYFVFIMQLGKETSKEVIDRYAHIAPEWSRTY
ncbi:methyltransferase domain protein [Oesophagostomum dentatum]|uniref:Methyltransferase domain protein n=1 Tax=Oesophagostomum dentatum TaxID=61180 RepID=A0A0B1TR25_OESDE|nr:methyltransferase domain protein [Oesophagostomum dentatum]